MKSKSTLLFCIAILFFGEANAQNYKWATGGGSSSSLMYSTDWEQVTHMCTDANRNIYVTTTMGDDNITADTFYMAHAFNPTCCGATPTPHIFIASYNPDGKIRWGKLLDAQYFSRSYGIAYDNAGSIYTIGYLYGNNKHLGYDTIITSTNLTSFIVKYDTSGKFKWIRFVGADDLKTRFNTGFQSNIAVDGLGYIHYYSSIRNGVKITSALTSTTGMYDLKYDSLGDLISAIKMPMDTLGEIRSIVFNKTTQSSYAVVNIQYPAGAGDHFWYLAKYKINDSLDWADTVNAGSGLGYVALDNYNHLYLTGGGTPFIFENDTFINSGTFLTAILKLDTTGSVQWSRVFNGYHSADNALGYLTLLGSNKVAIAGVIDGTIKSGFDSLASPSSEGWNPAFAVLDTAGNLLKLDQLHGDAAYDLATSIISDYNGDFYIGGWVGDSIYANNIKAYHTNGGETDFFIIKYGYNDGCNLATEPTPMFSVSGDSTHVPATMTFAYTGANTPYSVKWIFGDGSTSRTLNPSHTYTDTGLIQVCLTVFGCDSGTYCNWVTTLKPTGVSNVKVFPELQVYPNPASDQLTIDHINIGTEVQLFDLIGRQVYTTKTAGNRQVIDVHELQAGVYVLQLTNKIGQKETVRVVKAQ